MIRNNYQNCYIMNLFTLLKSSGLDDSSFIKYLFYEVNCKSDELDINTNNGSILESLNEDHNLEFKTLLIKENNQLDEVFEEIHDGKKCVVFVDIFFLKYCIFFKDHHELHAIGLSKGDSEGKYHIVDPYYGYTDEFSEEELRVLIADTRDNLCTEGVSLTFVENIEQCTYDVDFSKVLKTNIRNLMSRSSKPEVLNGIESLAFFKEFSENLSNENISYPYLEEIYTSFKEIAMQHEGFSRFCEFSDFTDISEIAAESAQNWLILAYLFLKSSVREDYDKYKHKILERLELISHYESKLLDIMVKNSR